MAAATVVAAVGMAAEEAGTVVAEVGTAVAVGMVAELGTVEAAGMAVVGIGAGSVLHTSTIAASSSAAATIPTTMAAIIHIIRPAGSSGPLGGHAAPAVITTGTAGIADGTIGIVGTGVIGDARPRSLTRRKMHKAPVRVPYLLGPAALLIRFRANPYISRI